MVSNMRAPMGSTTPIISAAMAMTTISSTKVKPRACCHPCLVLRPTPSVTDVCILSFTAGRAIGSHGDYVVLAALTREAVDISLPPRIGRHLVLSEIRTIPADGCRRLPDQSLQAVFVIGKASHIQLVQFQRAFQVVD